MMRRVSCHCLFQPKIENGLVHVNPYDIKVTMALLNPTISHILSLIDMPKTRGRVSYAMRNNHKDFTFVLFEYTSSPAGCVIHHEEMTPYGTSLQATLTDFEVVRALTTLLCPNDNFLLHTRRKIDHAADGGIPTEKRQFVMKVYADQYHDLPSLISLNSNNFVH